jgi:hypothetical protein
MRFRPDERRPLKRLALLWLACAAVGFTVAVTAAVLIALVFDRPPAWQATAEASPAAAQRAPHNAAPPSRTIDTGRRLLGE